MLSSSRFSSSRYTENTVKLVSREIRLRNFFEQLVEIQHRADLSGQLGKNREELGIRRS